MCSGNRAGESPLCSVQVMSIAMNEFKPPVVVSSMTGVNKRVFKHECGLLTDEIIPYSTSKHWLPLFPELLIFKHT